MSDPATFVGADAFAMAAGIGLRCARKALSKAASGGLWRSYSLNVRIVAGRGGKAGATYEVEIGSLPPSIQAQIPRPTQPDLPLIAPLATSQDWRMRLVMAVLAAGDRASKARGDKIAELALSARYPFGKRSGQPIPARTIREWVASYEKRGMTALSRSRRADRGRDRVIAWRGFDNAMEAAGVSEAVQKATADQITEFLKGLAKDGANSVANFQFLAGPKLRDLALKVAPGLTRPELDLICRMPVDFVRNHTKKARLAYLKKSDAGGWAAKMVPTIRRDRSELKPMEMLAADVRHSDIFVQRPDGTLATPKFIAFMDLATNRIWVSIQIMPKGEMIRRQHVLAAFRDLFANPSWGVPQQLYLDNGGEFRVGLAADDLTAIAQLVRHTNAIELGMFDAPELSKTGVLNSLPYRPKSKIIETIFSIYTRSIEPMFPGFAGGNRMVQKVENQGRAKAPMPGDEAEIQRQFAMMVDFYNARRQTKGHIKGLSPNEAFAKHVADGWKSIVCLPAEFTLAFGKDETRRVQTGGEFQCGNDFYRHDDLAIKVGERIRIRVPSLDANGRIPVLDDKGDVRCGAAVSPRFAMRDEAGAREQGRRTGGLNKQLKAEVAGVPTISVSENLSRAIAELPKPPAPEQLATISIHPLLRQAATEPAPIVMPTARSTLKNQFESARIIGGFRAAG